MELCQKVKKINADVRTRIANAMENVMSVLLIIMETHIAKRTHKRNKRVRYITKRRELWKRNVLLLI